MARHECMTTLRQRAVHQVVALEAVLCIVPAQNLSPSSENTTCILAASSRRRGAASAICQVHPLTTIERYHFLRVWSPQGISAVPISYNL